VDVGRLPALVFVAKDQPGIVATVTSTLAGQGGNIATMKVSRRRKGGEAIHIYELDEPASEGALAAIRALPQVRALRAVPRIV
jgi:L-serine dehydratase